MRKVIIVLFIVFLTYADEISATSSHIDSLYSPSLARTMRFSIILPSDYDSMSKYPVLYLLHGGGGNHQTWLNYTNIEDYVDEYPMIVIMPDGGESSFYLNSHTDPQNRYEDYMINDLPNFVQQKYAIDTTRQSIAGFSMGGFGALVLGLRHPDRFWFAASLSGPIMIPRDLETINQLPRYKHHVATMDKIFGETPNEFRASHNVFQLYKKTPVDKLPYIFLITGIQDRYSEIFTTQKEMADSLKTYGANFEYHEIPGKHKYSQIGNTAIPIILQRMESIRKKGGVISLANMLSKTQAEKGIDQAINRFNYLKDNSGNTYFPYYLDRNEMNKLGYALLEMDKIDEAISVFKLNIDSFPKSANAYDSISDAYLKNGENELALEYAEKTLNALSDDPYESAMEKDQLKRWAKEKIERIKAENKPETKK